MAERDIPAHTVRFEIGPFGVAPVFNCYARVGEPFCRLTCPGAFGCESGDECRESGHEPVDYGRCMFVEWMDSEDGIEAFSGDRTALRGGHIVPEWRGDHWTWSYATPAGRIPEPAEVSDVRA
ncbi:MULTISPECIES: hypothetical protein [Nocardia]|jgi:hypothetical protein|uniref:hypothetical protein n=1 Tax=Nocardia TaxID=1817 RepID=UPI002458B9C1|nr:MULTISPECIES: hypothetical protein [Nocardia]